MRHLVEIQDISPLHERSLLIRNKDQFPRTTEVLERLTQWIDKPLPEGISPLFFHFLCEVTERGLWEKIPEERTYSLLRDHLIGDEDGNPARDFKELVPRYSRTSARLGQIETEGIEFLYHALENVSPENAHKYPKNKLHKDKSPRRRVHPFPLRRRSRSEAATEREADPEFSRRKRGIMRSDIVKDKISDGMREYHKRPGVRERQAKILERVREQRRKNQE